MSYDNDGTQSGDHSLNVGVGDFRGANVVVGGDKRPFFTSEQMQVRRHPALGGKTVKRESLNTFGIITGAASLVGLYFTLFQPFPHPKPSSWPMLFVFSFGIGAIGFFVATALRLRRFENFFSRKHYIEVGNKDGLHLSSFTATCPWCKSRMNLRHVGPKGGNDDRFICERNPRQHTIELDPTVLPEIEEP